ncbi:hypothetical protein HUU61_13280 [Rhodopseudomonas palustris]|nr:hypothetical protein [Rhodopseudomonas palustris]
MAAPNTRKEQKPRHTIVVSKSSASAIFEADQQIVMNFEGEPGTFSVTFWTEYGGNYEIPVPQKLCAEGRGLAHSLEDAAERFANAARVGSDILSLVANADLGALHPELVFDASLDDDAHDFLQIFVPDPPLRAIPNRRTSTTAATAVSSALAAHPDLARLRRAVAQHSIALSLWNPGNEIQCLAHLYMGIESLTKAVLRKHLSVRDLREDQLIQEWKIDKKKLDADVRRRLIFLQDQETYNKAKAVSDGFEHGFLDYNEMRNPAREVIVRTARYLRQAILDTLSIDEDLKARLRGIDEPRGPINLIRYLRGTLSGNADRLAAPDQRYPIMQWHSKLETVVRREDGKYSFTPSEQFTPRLGDGVTFSPSRLEIWDGSSIGEWRPN